MATDTAPRCQVEVCAVDDFLSRAESWDVSGPFPVPDAPALTAYREALGITATGPLPPVRTSARSGVVVSTDDPWSEAAARLLATATGRRYLRVRVGQLLDTVAAHDDAPVAVVGSADSLRPLADWPGMYAEQVGVISAADGPSLACLVYRILTVSALPVGSEAMVVHPLFTTSANPDWTSFSELKPISLAPVNNLEVMSHGRECAVNLPDGVICARPGAVAPPLPAAQLPQLRVPSCYRNGECFRADLTDDQRIDAAEFRARVVFLQTCISVAVGTHAFPPNLNVASRFLAGTAVAVIGMVGLSAANPAQLEEFRRCVAQQVTLGEAVERLNTLARARYGTLARYGLLGDPTAELTAAADDGPGESSAVVVAEEQPMPLDFDLVAELERLNVTLDRLARLEWLGVTVDRERIHRQVGDIRRAANLLVTPTEAKEYLAGLAGAVADLQADILADLIEQVHGTWWHFGDVAVRNLRQLVGERQVCPACGVSRATLMKFEHRVERPLRLRGINCRRCLNVFWSTGAGDEVTVTGGGEIVGRRGASTSFSLALNNPAGDRVAGAVGVAAVAGRYAKFSPGQVRRQIAAPHTTATLAWTIEIPREVPRLDEYQVASIGLFDGEITVWTSQLLVVAEAD